MTWTLTGRFARPDGTPAHGRVLISTTPAVLEDDTGDVVYVSPVELTLDAEGRIPDNEFPFSDDPAFPDPPVYRLEVKLSHRTLTPLEGVQVDTGTDAVDYADLARSVLGPTVREMLADLGLRVDALEGATADAAGRLDVVEGRTDALEGRADALEGRADALEGRADTADGRLDGLDDAVADLDQRLTSHAADPTAHTIPDQIADAVAIIDGGTL